MATNSKPQSAIQRKTALQWMRLVDAWAAGRTPIPAKWRSYLTQKALAARFGENSSPGTWNRLRREIPNLQNDPLIGAFSLGREHAWRLGKRRLENLPDQAFIKTALESLEGSQRLDKLKAQQASSMPIPRDWYQRFRVAFDNIVVPHLRVSVAKQAANRRGGKVTAEKRKDGARDTHTRILDLAKKYLEAGRNRYEIANLIAARVNRSKQHVRKVLRAASSSK